MKTNVTRKDLKRLEAMRELEEEEEGSYFPRATPELIEEVRISREKFRLKKAVAEFAEAMRAKLLRKAEEGYGGWTDKRHEFLLQRRLIRHVEKGLDKDNLVDIANFCMMLWGMNK